MRNILTEKHLDGYRRKNSPAAMSRTVQPLRTPAATIRAAITKAYGKLLGQLESKGLVTLTQTEDEAIDAAAQARADKTGQPLAEVRASLMGSVSNSLSPMKSIDANVRRGREALARALDEQTSVHRAMYRNGLGWVDFVWGDAGAVRPSGKTKGAMGIAHIFEARQRKDGMTDAQVVRLLDGIVGAIASGQEIRRNEVAATVTVVVEKDGIEALLTKKPGSNTWLVSGWSQKNPDALRAGSVASGATPAKPTTAQPGRVAGFAQIMGANDLDIKRSANGAIQGFFDPQTGQSFLIADNLTAEAAPGVLMHEVGIHMAADGSMKALFNRAAMMLKLQRGNPFIKQVQARMDAAGETSGEEAAAYIAEAYENDRANAPASVQRWLADLLAAVKAWMFKKGIMGADRLTVADIAAVARANARSMARGYVTRSNETAQQAIDRAMTAFSRDGDGDSEAARQLTETERTYGGREAYDRAKAAGKTKLTYGQWVQVRTPNFKNWFGDWEAVRARDTLQNMDAVPARLDSAFGAEFSRAKALAKAEFDKLRDKTERDGFAVVAADGRKISFSGRGFKEVAQHAADRRVLSAAANLQALFESAVPLYSAKPEDVRQQVAAFHYYGVKADFGKDGQALVLLEVVERTNGDFFYDADATTVEEVRAASSAPLADQTKSGAGGFGAARSGRLAQWASSVNPATVSKVIDPDTGEPLVVYHGTRRAFDAFTPGKPRGAIGNPAGIYFDTNKEVAEEFAMDVDGATDERSRIVEAFVRVTGDEDGQIRKRTERGRNQLEVIAFRPEQVKSAIGNNGDFDPADGRIDHFGAKRTAKDGTPTDRAVMAMAREGASVQDVLKLIDGTSKSRFNRQIARLLLKTGVSPKLEALSVGGLGQDKRGFNLLAKYSRQNDAISLTDGAGYMAEQIVLHELIHAATLRALDKPGLYSLQMRRLFEHVKRQGGINDQYGMKNVGEFVAELFTNPEFQRALRGMSAPSGSTLKTAWDGFVRILRSILGLPQDAHDALSQALELGVAVMREQYRMGAQGGRGGADAYMEGQGIFGRAKQTWASLVDAHIRGTLDSTKTHELLPQSPSVMRMMGLPDLPIRVGSHTLDSLYNHGVTPSQMKRLLDELAAPRLAMIWNRGRNGETSLNFVTSMSDAQGEPFVIALHPNKGSVEGRHHWVATVTPRNPNALLGMVRDGGAMYVGEGEIAGVDAKALREALQFAKEKRGKEARELKAVMASSHELPNLVQQTLYAQDLERFKGEQGDDAYFGAADLNRLKTSAIDQLHQALSHPGKVSLWDKTVGTMRHLAERSPVFKRVFDSAQGFVDDVSHYANDAAELAPKLLPKLETWRDIAKRPISAADNAAVAKPVFEGTLDWARDEAGTPVRLQVLLDAAEKLTPEQKAQRLLRNNKISEGMLKAWQGLPLEQYEKLVASRYESQMLQAGIVWTPAELKSQFKLNDAQVALYQEFRAATDRSLDTMARSDMLRFGGEDVKDLADMVMDAKDAQDAAQILRDHLLMLAKENPDRAGAIGQLANGMLDRAARVQELQEQGYAPLSRFGKYTVDVVDAGGERQYFGLFETAREANIMAMKMRKGFGQDAVTQGTLSDEKFKLLAGITPESLELFGNMLGLDDTGDDAQDQAFQEYLRRTKTNRSAMRRLIHRQGISGYSEDVGRVLASFVYSNARLAAGGLNAGTLETAIEAIPKEQGELRDVAMGLRSYIQDPQEEGQAVRGMLFAQYLGGSVASALVNMTQPFQITMPWLSQFGGMRKAGAHLAGALRDMARGGKYEPDLAQALHAAQEDGVASCWAASG